MDRPSPNCARRFASSGKRRKIATLLLYPEGMVKLSGSAGEILKRCDGEATVSAILADLSSAYPGADLSEDVYAFLQAAFDNGWLDDASTR